ncbi:MAG: hypothetical protein HYW01_04915 [Deltaproteobacteria bacterium]|nr:hypothetical protein [Deltaproteobacteria bacterium]
MKYEGEKKQLVDGLVFIFDQRTGELEVVETQNNCDGETLKGTNAESSDESDVISD